MQRTGECERKTKETQIFARLELEGIGKTVISTGLPFFDHMLELMFRHALIDAEIRASGDLEVDSHHTVEDTGIVIGKALDDALGDRKGINRFSSAIVPMDECLAEAALDISGRPYLSYRVNLEAESQGNFDPGLSQDFFQSVVNQARVTLHIELRQIGGVHHSLESVFKAVGRALKAAIELDPRVIEIPSTKGTL